MRIFFLILDAFDPARLQPRLTPHLWRWANADGAVTGTGRAVMAACTYPNHATFVTGAEPGGHGIFANHVIRDGKVAGAWEVGPLIPTLFDRYGAEAVAVLGDHHLVQVMGAQAAASHWPLQGDLSGIELDPLGYPSDAAVMPALLAGLEAAPRFLVGYLGSIDTYSHLYGPSSEEALTAYRQLDARIGALDASLAWDDSILIVVSDHIQNTAADRPGIDLRAALGEGALVVDEGSAALISGKVNSAAVQVDGVAGAITLADGNTLAWCEPGRYFGPHESPILRGVHGNEATRTQLALVTGGHPQRRAAAELVRRGPVPATAWAGLISGYLEDSFS